MKKILATAILAALFIPAAHAVNVTNNFTVAVNLSSQCRASNNNTQTIDFGTYTAFVGPSVAAPTAALTFDCTRGFAPTSVAFDTTNGLATGEGVLAGLQYGLSAAAAVVTNGNAATTASIGTADSRSYTVTGSMAAGQAGTGAGGAASHIRQLIVTY
jgi:hypothetical protein